MKAVVYLDIVGSQPWAACRRVLTSNGKYVLAEAVKYVAAGQPRGKVVIAVR